VLALQGAQLEDSSAITGTEIRDALRDVNHPAGEVVMTGADAFQGAVGHIVAGRPINYEGASGPMDFDPQGNVRGRLAHFRFEEGGFRDLGGHYDCVSDPNTCPRAP
jgi:hypothetical protein